MRIFDVYEHPTFEVQQADKPRVRTTIRRLGVGAATVSAIAAISFWGYYWSDSSSDRSLVSAVGRLAFGALTIPVRKGGGAFEGNESPGL